MHHTNLNIPDLLLPLWRGKMKKRTAAEVDTWNFATLRNNAAWKQHGEYIASCAPYWPGSFDRVPRNPAEKLNSGYKAWEFGFSRTHLTCVWLLVGVLCNKSYGFHRMRTHSVKNSKNSMLKETPPASISFAKAFTPSGICQWRPSALDLPRIQANGLSSVRSVTLAYS